MTTQSPILATLFSLAITAMLTAPGPAVAARARNEMIVPDFTKGGKIPAGAQHDWNLGATGARGWINSDMLVTTDVRSNGCLRSLPQKAIPLQS